MHMNKSVNGACKTGKATNSTQTWHAQPDRQFGKSYLFVHATNAYSELKWELKKNTRTCYRVNTGKYDVPFWIQKWAEQNQ